MLAIEDQNAMGEGQHIEETNFTEGSQGSQGMQGEGEAKTEMQQSKREEEKPKNTRPLNVCPMCCGTGFMPEVNYLKKQEETPENTDNYSYALPSISKDHKSIDYHTVEQLFRKSKSTSRMSDSAVSSVVKLQTRLPPVHVPNSAGVKQLSAGQVKSSPGNCVHVHLENLLPLPRKLDRHPEDVARLAAIKLNRNEWETRKAGLDECLLLARSNQDELEPYMSLVYRTLSAMTHCHHPNLMMYACQASSEFFVQMRSTCRPEYDELVYSLLSRTADVKKSVRDYANNALDRMVTHIPPSHAVRPLAEKGPIHNNPLVRGATARLLTCVAALKTPVLLLTTPNLRETCKRIIETATTLLADSNMEVRNEAKKLISRFMVEEEFESFYYAEVDEKIRKKAHRIYLDIKSKTKTM